ncbi:hypothetical protein BSKO_13577 [Bryopsis sp. KO-2023]|nr:hypothetical protein BSKO_13577 [Bryopsis sp. KO-2023]
MPKNRIYNVFLESFRRFYRTASIDTMLWTFHTIEFTIYTILALVEYFLFGFSPFITIARTALSFCGLRVLPLLHFQEAKQKYGSPSPPHLQLSKFDQTWTLIWGYISFVFLYFFMQPFDRWVTPLLESDCLRSRWRGENHLRGNCVEHPVLLVHGFCCNSMFWLPTRAYLYWMGVRDVFSVSLAPCLGDISAYARTISNKVDAILQKTGAEKVIIVGHSMGGIASRCYIHELNGFSKVEKLIALASPHNGTQIANWSPLKLLKLERSCILQMAVGSSFLEGINRMEISKEGPKVPMTNIFSYDDDIVLPQESSILERGYPFGYAIFTKNKQVGAEGAQGGSFNTHQAA